MGFSHTKGAHKFEKFGVGLFTFFVVSVNQIWIMKKEFFRGVTKV